MQLATATDAGTTEPTWVYDVRRNGRKSKNIAAARNNAFVNRHAAAPHVTKAWNANTDFQSINNQFGAGVYCTSYVSKAEDGDGGLVAKILAKNLSRFNALDGNCEKRLLIREVASAILTSSVVCAQQAMYVLLDLEFVSTSRNTVSINTLPRAKVEVPVLPLHVLEQNVRNDRNAPAVDIISPRSQMGRRNAYSELLVQQFKYKDSVVSFSELRMVTFFALFSQYTIQKADSDIGLEMFDEELDSNTNKVGKKGTRKKKSWNTPPLLVMDGLFLSENCPSHFQVGEYQFNKQKKKLAIHLSPYITFDRESEDCAFMLLLLYLPWPNANEDEIVPLDTTAVDHLKSLGDSAVGLSPSLIQLIANHEEIQESKEEMRRRGGPRSEGLMGESPLFHEHIPEDDLSDEDENVSMSGEDPTDETEIEAGTLDNEEDKDVDPTLFKNLSHDEFVEASRHVDSIQRDALNKLRKKNSIGPNSSRTANIAVGHDVRSCVPYADIHQLKEQYNIFQEHANEEQHKAFSQAEKVFNATDPSQLLMVVSGEAGTGKTFLIDAIVNVAKLIYGKTECIYGPAIVMAATGAAACNANGFTWQYMLNKRIFHRPGETVGGYVPVTVDTGIALQRKLNGVQVVIIDEMSLISLQSLYDIHRRLQAAQTDRNKSHKPFGGFHVILLGDLYQVEFPMLHIHCISADFSNDNIYPSPTNLINCASLFLFMCSIDTPCLRR